MDHGRSTILTRAAGRLRSLYSGVGGRLRAGAQGLLGGTVVVPSNLSGERVDERSVLSVTSAWAAVTSIASDVSTLPLELRRRGKGGSSSVVRTHPAARLFNRSPDGGQTTTPQFLAAMLVHRQVSGNAYARIDWSGGWPVRLTVLDPAVVRPFRDQDGDLAYQVVGQTEPLLKDRVLHFAGPGGDGVGGYSPTLMASQTLGLSRAAEGYAAGFFGNGAEPGGFWTLQGATEEKLKEFQAGVSQRHGGAARHSPAAYSGNVTFQKTGSTASEAQVLELRQFQVIEAARIWRVGPHKLGDYSKASYSSVEQANLAHVTETLRPLCEQIEAALDLRLLTDAEVDSGLHFAFDLSAFLRADTAARSAWLRNMSASGMITIDEGRAVEGLPPLPDGKGEALMVPLNTAPLDQVVNPPAEGTRS